MKKFYFVLLAALCSFTTVHAEKRVRWGVRGGVSILTPNMKNLDEILNRKIKTSFQVGAIMDLKLVESLYLQPGVFYTGRGGKLEYGPTLYDGAGNPTGSEPVTYTLNYLQIPVLLSYRFPLGQSGQPVFHLNAGPYFAAGLGSGKIKYAGGDSDAFGKEFEEDFRRFDCGVIFGWGLGIERFYVGLNYDLGIYHTTHKYTSVQTPDKFKNRSWNILVGFTF